MAKMYLDLATVAYTPSDDGVVSCESLVERLNCTFCGKPDCNYDCDDSQGAAVDELESEEEVASRLQYNAAVDGAESMLIAMVSELSRFRLNKGFDLVLGNRDELNRAFNSAIDKINNQFA